MSQDIKIGVALDTSSIRGAGLYLDGLTNKVRALNSELNKTTQSAAKINTGG